MAQSTSWAFVYYLSIHSKTPHLLRIRRLLNEMPRHMELNEQALQTCFAKAFDLEDACDDPPQGRPRQGAGLRRTRGSSRWRDLPLENGDVEAFHNDAHPMNPMGRSDPALPTNPRPQADLTLGRPQP